MAWMVDRYRALRSLLRREHLEDDVAEELEFHLAMRTEEYVARGMTPEAAREEALRRFGSVDAYRRQTHMIDEGLAREQRRMELWDMVRRETRQALRSLARSPAFAVMAVLTLALGLGATTALYSVVDAVVLRPLPYAAPEQLVWLDSPVPGVGPEARWGLSEAGYFHFAREAHGLSALGVFSFESGSLATDEGAARVDTAWVSASMMDVLRARPALGRLLPTDGDLPGAPRIAVLGYDFWVRQYGADPRVLGMKVRLDGVPTEVVGVMAPGLHLPDDTVDLWAPLMLDPSRPPENSHWLQAVGRLRDGVTVAQAQAELTALTARLPALFPGAYSEDFMRERGFSTAVTPLARHVVGDVDRVLWFLLGSVALVLLIACANVANLFLVRAEARRRELAVRSALGAARGDLAWHALTESLLLCLLAGGLGLSLAWGALRLMLALAPPGLPRLEEVGLGVPGVAFAAVLSVAAGLVFGLFPLTQAGRGLAALRESGRGLTSSRRRNLVRGGIVVGQVGLAVVLLAAAGLMLRSYWTLYNVDPGFQPGQALTFDLVLPETRYPSSDEVNRFHRELLARLEALPGVSSVGAASRLPLRNFSGCAVLFTEGGAQPSAEPPCLPVMRTAPGYFESLGIPLRQGRELTWEDLDRKADGVVVTNALAERLWPGEAALGKGIRGNGHGPPYYRVIGVTGELRAHGLDKPPSEAVFFPLAQAEGLPLWGPARSLSVVVRTATTRPESLAPAVRDIMKELDPSVPLANVETLERVVAKSPSVARASFTLFLLGIAGGMALLLSVVGLYGVISFIVGQRRGELGIRMALGARAAQVAGLVVFQALRFAALGIVLGLAGTLAMSQVLGALLFEVSPTDPVVLAAVCALLVALAVLASYGPARRAARVDPAEVLRSE
ncbi:ABC transporter permease [Pyxidicoccus xibeiensis]|uniref:ABC transporter permease n=1 Tax=Pyxidicoccus xibeiensis TaxID=2906759 RepID=UPI0020A7DE6D|nr:ABC transporter permease [Pyxidicoccus xibeiensis]MCP3141579.1 ABC transporter permease [Pyxidicoccus xibeiensis]